MEQLTAQHYLLLGRKGGGVGGCESRVLSVQQITIQYLLKGKGSEIVSSNSIILTHFLYPATVIK